MDKTRFANLFQEAIRRAFDYAHFANAPQALVRFEGKPNPAQPISIAQALELLWLAPDQFYRIVDVAVLPAEDPPIIFVRPSGHLPGPFQDTLNPSDLGPFNVLITEAHGAGL